MFMRYACSPWTVTPRIRRTSVQAEVSSDVNAEGNPRKSYAKSRSTRVGIVAIVMEFAKRFKLRKNRWDIGRTSSLKVQLWQKDEYTTLIR